jgi:hypothetical protein
MSAETRKQLLVGYCVLSALIALTAYWTGWPWIFYGWLSDPDLKTLFMLIATGFLPGVVAAYIVGPALLLALALAGLAVGLAVKALWELASSGIVGTVTAVVVVGAIYWQARKLWLQHQSETIAEIMLYVRLIVEFFAWLNFLLGFGARKVGLTESEAANRPGSIRVAEKENSVSQTQTLEIVRAEIMKLQATYPELPAPPEAYHANRYEGWFSEARKRFEM